MFFLKLPRKPYPEAKQNYTKLTNNIFDSTFPLSEGSKKLGELLEYSSVGFECLVV